MKRAIWLSLYTIAVVATWEIVVRVAHVPHYILPPPSDIAAEFIAQPGLLLAASWVTLCEAVGGFVLGGLVSVALALLIVLSPLAETVVMPTVLAIQSVPKVAVAPLFVVWFGLGFPSKLVLVCAAAFFPMLLSTLTGFKNVDAEMIDLIRGMNGSKLQAFLKVRVPFSIPFIFAGMKIAVPMAMIGAIVAEFISSEQGLGNLILVSSQDMHTSLNFASLIIIALLSALIFQAVTLAERVVWHFLPSLPKS